MAQDTSLVRKDFTALLERVKPQIANALPKHMTVERVVRTAMTEMNRNPKLFDCDQKTVLASIIVAAQLGLEVGVNGQAYLVPYKGICQLIPGWRGYVDLVSRSGRASCWTGAVRASDKFSYRLGAQPTLSHIPDDDDDLSNFTHVYAVGWVNGARFPVVEVFSRAKVNKHLAQYNRVGDSHYAKQNENNLEMYGRKIALLQVLKYMPMSVEMQSAMNVDYTAEAQTQHLSITSDGIMEGEYLDVSTTETAQQIDKAPSRTDAVAQAVKADAKKKPAPAPAPAQSVQETVREAEHKAEQAVTEEKPTEEKHESQSQSFNF